MKPNDPVPFIFFLFFIFLLGFFVRIFEVDKNPAGFFCDEASIGYNAYTVLKTGRDEWGVYYPLLFRAFDSYKDPVFIYSTVPIIKFFGLSEFAVRLTSVIYGSLAVWAIYLFAKELFNKYLGVISAFFLAISPWHIHFSRVGFELISATFWFPLSLYFFLKSIKNFKYFYPFFVVSSFITFFTYYPIKIILPLVLVGAFFLYFNHTWRWLKTKEFWLVNLATIILFILLMKPYLRDYLFLRRWNEVKSKSITPNFLFTAYVNHFSFDFLFSKGDIDFPGQFITRHSVKGMGELYFFQLPLIILGLIKGRLNRYRNFFLLLWLIFLYPLGSMFTDNKPQATRSILGVIPFQVLSALGVWIIFFWLRQRKLIIRRVGYFLSFLVILFSFFKFLKLYQQYPLYSADYWGWQYGSKEIISYFKQHTKQYDELFMTSHFNAPEIFLKFYDPQKTCFNCYIGGVDSYNKAKKQLFAIRVEEFPKVVDRNFRIKKIIYYPNKEEAFYIGEFD